MPPPAIRPTILQLVANPSGVQAVLAAWSGSSSFCEQRLAANLCNDQLLPDADVANILNQLAHQVANGGDPVTSFDLACRNFKLRGPAIGGVMPTLLGRAISLDRFCRVLHQRVPDITEMQFEKLLRRHATSSNSLTQPKALKEAPLGGKIIWSTFRNPMRNDNPFLPPLDSRDAVRTALGLGEEPATKPLVVLLYDLDAPSARHDLHIPTVADAGNYAYFKPVPPTTPLSDHGWTDPLPPNPGNLPPQPEIVHHESLPFKLRFPILIFE